MTQINLLPWREQARQTKKTRFGVTMAIFVGAAIVFVLIIHLYSAGQIRYQDQRNEFLQGMINKQAGEIGALNKKKKELAAIDKDLHFIAALREKSYQVVRMLDELVRVVPDAVLLNKIIRQGNSISILGKAQSDVQITLFMKNLTDSKIFKQPVLTEINSKQNTSGEETYFQLRVEAQEYTGK